MHQICYKRKVSKIASKPLRLLTHPVQELQLENTGPIEKHNGKKYLLVAIDRFSSFPLIRITKLTSGNTMVKYLQTYIDTHGISELIQSDQFRASRGNRISNFVQKTI